MTLTPIAERLPVEARSVMTGNRTPISRMRGFTFTPLRAGGRPILIKMSKIETTLKMHNTINVDK